MGRGIEYDDSEWPIVKVRFLGDTTVDDVDEMYAKIDAAIARGPHIQWTDLREINPLTIDATLRVRAAEHEKRVIETSPEVVLADVRIVRGAVVRGMLTAFEWVSGSAPWPVKNVGTPEEAYAWLRELGVLDTGTGRRSA